MLHGRTQISVPNGLEPTQEEEARFRWLQGCYVNIDEFANTWNLHRRRSDEAGANQSIGNQDWAHVPSFLPPQRAA